jgi:hypothetical protein
MEQVSGFPCPEHPLLTERSLSIAFPKAHPHPADSAYLPQALNRAPKNPVENAKPLTIGAD